MNRYKTINKKEDIMKVTGIIMECNPFHEGHAYILREARRLTQADYIVVAMSGDFVQRGEPAVFDKYIRAEQILRAGADLVLEIPLYAACSSAEYFARGGVALLEKLGVVTDLCFGSESGDLDNLLRCAGLLTIAEKNDYSDSAVKYRAILQAGLKDGMPFPAARAAALEALYKEEVSENLPGENMDTAASGRTAPALHYPSVPNDLLAVEYCRALLLSGSDIRPHAISRIDVPSATMHRKDLLADRLNLISDGQKLPQTSVTKVPLFPIGPDDFSDQLMYALRMYEKDLEDYADVSADLAGRIRKQMGSYPGFTGFCDLINTRSLTRTRVSRCLLHILLQIRQERLDALQSAGMVLYERPLAINRAASPLLSMISQNAAVPFLPKMSEAESHLSPKAYAFLEEELRAEDLYCMTLNAAAKKAMPANALPDFAPSALQRKVSVLRTCAGNES